MEELPLVRAGTVQSDQDTFSGGEGVSSSALQSLRAKKKEKELSKS